MILRSNLALQTVDPDLLAQAMNRFVAACSPTQLERGIVKSIPTLDEPHRGALARALTDDKLFADVSKVDGRTLKETVALSRRCGELHESFLYFLKSNPRALEQLHPSVVNGIFAGMESHRVVFDDMSIPRRSRDIKVGAFAALATLLISAVAYAGWGALRSQHRDDAPQLAVFAPIYQATPNPASLQKAGSLVHAPVRKRTRAPLPARTPVIERVFVKQVVVKEVQSQAVPATSAAKPRISGPQAAKSVSAKRDAGRQRAAIAHRNDRAAAASIGNNRSATPPRSDRALAGPSQPAAGPAKSLQSRLPVVAAVPKAVVGGAAPIPVTIQTPAPPLTARDFVASTIRAAAPDSKITSLWVSDGGGDLTVVEAESANRSGAFYDKYVVRPSSGGGFSITSHEQIPISPSGERAAAPSFSPKVEKKPRALFGHIRRPHP